MTILSVAVFFIGETSLLWLAVGVSIIAAAVLLCRWLGCEDLDEEGEDRD